MNDFFKQAQEMKQREAENKTQLENKTPGELIKELERAKTIRDTKHNAEELKKELYRRAIDNIRISDYYRIQINKNNFEDKDEVIDILLYIVGKMAQDPIFYKTNIHKLKDHKPIYEKEAE